MGGVKEESPVKSKERSSYGRGQGRASCAEADVRTEVGELAESELCSGQRV